LALFTLDYQYKSGKIEVFCLSGFGAASASINAVFRNDKLYEKEYERFVMGMSYAENNAVPSFNVAIERLASLIGFVNR